MQKLSVVLTPRVLSPALWVLAALALGVGALGFYLLAEYPEEPIHQAGPAVEVSTRRSLLSPESVSAAALKELAANPLFGPAPQESTSPTASEPRLSVSVVGTILRGAASRAVVETGNGQKLVGIGDELEGGEVVEISREGIQVDFGDRQVVVPVTASARVRHGAPQAVPTASRSVAVASPGAVKPAPAGYEEDASDIDLEEFDSFAEQMRAGLDAASASTAHDATGQAIGLVLEKIPEESVMRRIGLQPQDVVTEINGIPVTSLAELKAAFDTVAQSVKRGDEGFILLDLIREQTKDTIILTIWS